MSHEYYNKYLDGESQLMALFESLPFTERMKRMAEGLRCPPDSGEYKWAKFQLTRLWSPVCAVIVPSLVLLLLICISSRVIPDRGYQVVIIEPEAIEQLEEIEPLEPPDEVIETPEDIEFDMETPTIEEHVTTPNVPFSPQPAEFDSVAIVKSPIMMKGIYGSRSPGARGSVLGKFGGSSATEGAVLRALRWLKKEQNSDGSWDKPKAAMTGLGLLTFLAHGETPDSEEFGVTVENAIRWLIDNQNEDGTYNHIIKGKGYSYPIATYALCEAYGMTRVPIIKDAAERGIDRIVKGQHASGGWDYMLKQSTRDDTSLMGWCCQALKAALMADIEHEDMDSTVEKAVLAMKQNYQSSGAWKYTNTEARHGKLASAGVLSLQLLGRSRDPEVRGGLRYLSDATFDLQDPICDRPIYIWYYVTQVKFHAGGETWNRWNREFAPALVNSQIVIKGAGLDGKDIGYWEDVTAKENYGLVYNTTMCTLMLEVYYRYLPTFKAVEVMEEVEIADEDIDIDISL